MTEDYPFEAKELNKELEGELEPGEELNEEDLDEIKIQGLPKKSPFPLGIFIFALAKDFIDLGSFGTVGTFINIIAWIVINIYLFGKFGFIKRWLYRRFIFALILEFIPFINMIPQWTIFVLRAYTTENKKVDQILRAIERLLLREAGTSKIAERFM